MYNTQFFYILENDFQGKVCGYYIAVNSRGLSNLLSYWSEYNMDGHILHDGHDQHKRLDIYN